MLGGEDVYERVFVAGHGWLFCDLVNGSMPPVGVDSKPSPNPWDDCIFTYMNG